MATKNLGVLISLVLLVVFLAPDIAAKISLITPATIAPAGVKLLNAGEPLKREIRRDEVQGFSIELSSGQYAEVVFEWQGINLSVTLLDPNGAKLIPAELQVSSPGPVTVSILADKTGAYKLEVRTTVKPKISGAYGLKLEDPRLPTAADHKRLACQTKIAEARNAETDASRIQKYKQALSLSEEANDLNSAARIQLLLGDAYKAARDLPNAKASYEKAADTWNKMNYPRGEAYAKVALAQYLRSLLSLKDALPSFEGAEALFALIGDRRGQSEALYGKAFTLMLLGQTPRAIEVLQQTLQICQADGDRVGEAQALNMMADAYRIFGEFEKCLELYDKANVALTGLDHPSLEASMVNGRALVADDQGFWQEARDEYAYALTLYESLLGQPVLNVCSTAPATKNASLCRSAAVAILNLGESYNSLGEPERALREFSKSLIISDALGRPVDQGAARFHIGYAQFLLGETAKALEYYQQALAFQQKAGDAKGEAQTYTYMGMAYTANGDPDRALALYQKALPIQIASGDKRALAITLDKIASGYAMVGNTIAASVNYSKALELWRTIKDPDGEALTLHNLAISERQAGNFVAANQHAEAALKLVESLRSALSSERFRASYLASKTNYYEINTDLKMMLAKSENRHQNLAAALESNERARARVLLDALSEAGVGRAEVNRKYDPRLAAIIEARLELQARLGAKARARTRLLSEKHTAEQIAKLDRDISEIGEKHDEAEVQLRSQSPRLMILTKPEPASLKEIQQLLDDKTLLLEFALGDKRSYVWAVTRNSIEGFELPARDKIEPVARRLFEALTARNWDLKNESFQQRVLRLDRAEKDYSETSNTLTKLILAPVASMLGQKRLVVVADGALQMVPFSALLQPADSAVAGNSQSIANSAGNLAAGPMPLNRAHEIITLPSASVLALQRRELANRQSAPYALAIIADPVFGLDDERVARSVRSQSRKDTASDGKGDSSLPAPPGRLTTSASANARPTLASALRDIGISSDGRLARLAHSRQEAAAIAREVSSGQSLSALDFKASRETATSSELSKYRIIHFATHGVLDLQHPELSGIVLSMVNEKGQPQDGYLRLHEIYNLNLPAELVVLSACETGIGKQVKGEGLIALTRGFMYAGARSVVASLWKVDDTATAELMTEFYKQMFTHKLKPAAALQAAQLKMSQQRPWQSPYYWAGFFIQGEWN